MTRRVFYWGLQSFVPASVLLALGFALMIGTAATDYEQQKQNDELNWQTNGSIVATFDDAHCRAEGDGTELNIRCLPA